IRLGFKGDKEESYDLLLAKGLVHNDPHLRQIAEEVGAMDVDDESRLIIALVKVKDHFQRIYGPLQSESRPVLDEVVRLLSSATEDLHRIANRLDPTPPDKVGTEYIAEKLGCSKQWVSQMVKLGKIPASCIVAGTGDGRQWKFHRFRI